MITALLLLFKGSFACSLVCSACFILFFLSFFFFFFCSYNQDSSCTQVVGTVGFPNGMCQPISATESVKFKWPNGYVYGTDDCSGSAEGSSAFPTTCDIPDPTEVDDTVQYDSYSTYTFVSSAISTRFIGFGAILSVVFSAMQLMKN
jgi:hypothetical protein